MTQKATYCRILFTRTSGKDKTMVMESRSLVARVREKVLITKGYVETFGGDRNTLPFCRKHSWINENV